MNLSNLWRSQRIQYGSGQARAITHLIYPNPLQTKKSTYKTFLSRNNMRLFYRSLRQKQRKNLERSSYHTYCINDMIYQNYQKIFWNEVLNVVHVMESCHRQNANDSVIFWTVYFPFPLSLPFPSLYLILSLLSLPSFSP